MAVTGKQSVEEPPFVLPPSAAWDCEWQGEGWTLLLGLSLW